MHVAISLLFERLDVRVDQGDPTGGVAFQGAAHESFESEGRGTQLLATSFVAREVEELEHPLVIFE